MGQTPTKSLPERTCRQIYCQSISGEFLSGWAHISWFAPMSLCCVQVGAAAQGESLGPEATPVCFRCNLSLAGGSPKLLLHLTLEVPSSPFPSHLNCMTFPPLPSLLPRERPVLCSVLSLLCLKINQTRYQMKEKAIKANKEAIITVSQSPGPSVSSLACFLATVKEDGAGARRPFLIPCAIQGR